MSLLADDQCRVCFHGPHGIPCTDIAHDPGPVDEDGNVPDITSVCGCVEYVDLEAESRVVVRKEWLAAGYKDEEAVRAQAGRLSRAWPEVIAYLHEQDRQVIAALHSALHSGEPCSDRLHALASPTPPPAKTRQPDGATMEEPLPILRKRIEVLKQEAGAALLDWYETTHGNTIGEHDHHCRASRWELRPHPSITISAGPNKGQPLMQNIEVGTGKPCTCGWSKAEAALKALHEREAERGA